MKKIKKLKKLKLERSKLEVYDIPLDLIVLSDENPNEQDDTTFDQLVEGIAKEGVDEPVLVVPIRKGKDKGKYLMASGEHRYKAAKLKGLKTIPGIIKSEWDDDQRKIELVRRNTLKGNLNPEKFTQLFNDLSKKYDKALLQTMMGFTKRDAFDKVYKEVSKSLPPEQKKKLEEARENITSVDDLSSVLNTIFKEHGSELDYGFLVFSFGGKNHHYIKCDTKLDKMLKSVEAECSQHGINIADVMKEALSSVDLLKLSADAKIKKRKKRKRPKK